MQVSENQEFSSDDRCRPNDGAQNSQQMPLQCSVFPLQNKNQPKCASKFIPIPYFIGDFGGNFNNNKNNNNLKGVLSQLKIYWKN